MIIKGDDLVLELGNKTQYHATSHQVNLDAEFEEYQTKDTDGKVNVLTGHTGTASTDGLVCVSESVNNTMDTEALIDAFNSGDSVNLTVKISDVIYTTTAWITNVSLTGQVAQNATYSVSFKFSKLEKSS
jgi:hypothetical protein